MPVHTARAAAALPVGSPRVPLAGVQRRVPAASRAGGPAHPAPARKLPLLYHDFSYNYDFVKKTEIHAR